MGLLDFDVLVQRQLRVRAMIPCLRVNLHGRRTGRLWAVHA
jgi:hypothetical protein